MKSLTLSSFKTWMDLYGKASQYSDPKAAAELFTQDAEYYETPFDEPLIGREAIYRYWSEASQNLKDVHFSYEILAVRGNRGVALWQGRFINSVSGKQSVLDGVFLVEFDEPGQCRLFREWWHSKSIDARPNNA